MGPSGAGKTTLLDFLTGMLGDTVHASGKVALPDDDAYVPQDDRLHSFYTCQSYMKHYARLKGMQALFDCCASKKAVQQDNTTIEDDEERDNTLRAFLESTPANIVDVDIDIDIDDLIADILSEVGLSSQMNTVVGGLFQRGLSGGQKRRLSVALEVLSSPLNLFLDEPTVGAISCWCLLRTYLLSSH
jgi:ABC-type multidrug transport system ATPase subunit